MLSYFIRHQSDDTHAKKWQPILLWLRFVRGTRRYAWRCMAHRMRNSLWRAAGTPARRRAGTTPPTAAPAASTAGTWGTAPRYEGLNPVPYVLEWQLDFMKYFFADFVSVHTRGFSLHILAPFLTIYISFACSTYTYRNKLNFFNFIMCLFWGRLCAVDIGRHESQTRDSCS